MRLSLVRSGPCLDRDPSDYKRYEHPLPFPRTRYTAVGAPEPGARDGPAAHQEPCHAVSTLNSMMSQVPPRLIYPVQPVTQTSDWSRARSSHFTATYYRPGARVWVTHVDVPREPHPSSHAMPWHATRTVTLHSVQDAHEPDLPCVGGRSRYTPASCD